MADPQSTPFVRFSTELLEAVIAAPMPATHKEIVLAVVRLTYGDFGKKDARISQRTLQHLTRRSKSSIADALVDLYREGVLLRLEPPTGSRATRLAIQGNYEGWGRYTTKNAEEIADHYRSGPPQGYRHALPQEYRQNDPSPRNRTEELGSLNIQEAKALALAAIDGDGIDCRLPEEVRDGIRAGTITREVVATW